MSENNFLINITTFEFIQAKTNNKAEMKLEQEKIGKVFFTFLNSCFPMSDSHKTSYLLLIFFLTTKKDYSFPECFYHIPKL